MTLAEFTAENMPENSVSKSGVCKGPKYFSYKGVTLYKLKELIPEKQRVTRNDFRHGESRS